MSAPSTRTAASIFVARWVSSLVTVRYCSPAHLSDTWSLELAIARAVPREAKFSAPLSRYNLGVAILASSLQNSSFSRDQSFVMDLRGTIAKRGQPVRVSHDLRLLSSAAGAPGSCADMGHCRGNFDARCVNDCTAFHSQSEAVASSFHLLGVSSAVTSMSTVVRNILCLALAHVFDRFDLGLAN